MSANTEIASKTKVVIKEPPMYKVIYINDNKTTVDFVIESLMQYFDYAVDTAERITGIIHNEGSAIAAVLPFEIAEQKGIEVTVAARNQGYPLQIRIEAEK